MVANTPPASRPSGQAQVREPPLLNRIDIEVNRLTEVVGSCASRLNEVSNSIFGLAPTPGVGMPSVQGTNSGGRESQVFESFKKLDSVLSYLMEQVARLERI